MDLFLKVIFASIPKIKLNRTRIFHLKIFLPEAFSIKPRFLQPLVAPKVEIILVKIFAMKMSMFAFEVSGRIGRTESK